MQLDFRNVSLDAPPFSFSHLSCHLQEGLYLIVQADPGLSLAFLRLAAGRLLPAQGEISFLGCDIQKLGRDYQRHISASSLFPVYEGRYDGSNADRKEQAAVINTLSSPAPLWFLHEPFTRTDPSLHPYLRYQLRKNCSDHIILLSSIKPINLQRIPYHLLSLSPAGSIEIA